MNKHLALACVCLWLGACVSSPDAEVKSKNLQYAQHLQTVGVGKYRTFEYRLARYYFNKALQEFRLIDNNEGVTTSAINIARSVLADGDAASAHAWIQQAAALNAANNLHVQQDLAPYIQLINAEIDHTQGATDSALTLLAPLLDSSHTPIQMSALKLRTKIAFEQVQAREHWLQRYATVLGNHADAHSHHARLARFQAALVTDAAQQATHYQRALDIYRELAHKPGIAATLAEWAASNLSVQRADIAEDQLVRALNIRLALKDAINCAALLQQMHRVYTAQDKHTQAQRTEFWRTQIATGNFDQWQAVMRDFEVFPDLTRQP
jgi:hypothetical protein